MIKLCDIVDYVESEDNMNIYVDDNKVLFDFLINSLYLLKQKHINNVLVNCDMLFYNKEENFDSDVAKQNNCYQKIIEKVKKSSPIYDDAYEIKRIDKYLAYILKYEKTIKKAQGSTLEDVFSK